jgi:hypothetical protein
MLDCNDTSDQFSLPLIYVDVDWYKDVAIREWNQDEASGS